MTRFRIVSLCLATFLFLGFTLPALAHPPCVIPAGLVETINTAIAHVLTWFGG